MVTSKPNKNYPLKTKRTNDSACFTDIMDNIKNEQENKMSTTGSAAKNSIAASKILKTFNRSGTMNNQDLEHLE